MRDHSVLTLRCFLPVVLLLHVACGGGSSPSGPSGTPPTPSVPTYSLDVTVFYDENGNGQLDSTEAARVPGVEVVVGTGTGTAAPGTGVAVVTGIVAGTHTVEVRAESLPAYYQAAAGFTVQVPATTEAAYPLVLPIANNNPHVYLGYGDSITVGEGSGDGNGYVVKLLNLLGPHFGRADVREWGRDADTSIENAEAVNRTLRWFDPAYTLILLGTNDWHDSRCKDLTPDCFTIESLRSIVLDVKAWQSLPVLATLPPVNPDLAPDSRNQWVETMNGDIRALAQEQGILLADVHGAFAAQSSLPPFFADDVHPNDAGYDLVAQAWFEAITRPRSAASSSRLRVFGFSLGD